MGPPPSAAVTSGRAWGALRSPASSLLPPSACGGPPGAVMEEPGEHRHEMLHAGEVVAAGVSPRSSVAPRSGQARAMSSRVPGQVGSEAWGTHHNVLRGIPSGFP